MHRTVFPSQAKVRTAIGEYIEVFYALQRIHSSLGYRTSAQAQADHNTIQQAASKRRTARQKLM